jgi:hypothetical protein
LFELITKAIVILHTHGAVVKGVVSDGAQPNKCAYAMFGIDGRMKNNRESYKFFIVHPLDLKTKIFFLLMYRIFSNVFGTIYLLTNMFR